MVALIGSELVGMREGHHKLLVWVEAPSIGSSGDGDWAGLGGEG